jgi:SHS2 domain-containing protein|tara:strand:+ start:173 stop:586 length:414 start_codon:yes stop_codon:yes gene_type:complete
MIKYKFIDEIKSDVMFEAYGSNLKELFANAAEAMFTIICKTDKVKPSKVEEFEIKGEKLEDTFWNWLSGLIAIVDVEEMFFSKFEIEEVDETHVKAKLYGSSIEPELGETVVKSLTNHRFEVKKTEEGYKAVVSLDI